MEGALAEVDRLEQTVGDLLALARGTVERTTVEIAVLLGEIERAWRGPLAAEGRALVVHGGDGLRPARAAGEAVRQILEVLLANAARHGAGTVSVHARSRDPGLAIDVADEGLVPEDPDEDLFARGPALNAVAHGGTGIGLALARALAEAEGGRLVLDRRGPHTCFTLLLMAQPVQLTATQPPQEERLLPGEREPPHGWPDSTS